MTPEERFTKIDKALQYISENQGRHESAIGDLIRLSRIFLDSQKQISTQIDGLREAQKHTDEKLNALIDTVDRIVRGPNPGSN